MQNQESMDGSPAFVTLYGSNKFEHQSDEAYVAIKFQCGPLKEVGVNGCSIEDVIDLLTARLEGFQRGPFRCRENALAITKLEEAKQWLLYRTSKRQAQGVEGTNKAHKDSGE